MRSTHFFTAAVIACIAVVILCGSSWAQSRGPSDETIKQAFQQIKDAADTNKDGKLTVAECMTIYKDKQIAETKCKFWDINGDGTITDEEYVAQVRNIGGKKGAQKNR